MQKYDRIRNKTVAFHVTPEEYDEITMRANISGMQKQDYLIARALEKEIVVHPNVRVKKYLEQYLLEIRDELQRISSVTEAHTVLDKLHELIVILERL